MFQFYTKSSLEGDGILNFQARVFSQCLSLFIGKSGKVGERGGGSEPKPNFTEICPTLPTNKGSLNYNYNCFFYFRKGRTHHQKVGFVRQQKKCGLVFFAKKFPFTFSSSQSWSLITPHKHVLCCSRTNKKKKLCLSYSKSRMKFSVSSVAVNWIQTQVYRPFISRDVVESCCWVVQRSVAWSPGTQNKLGEFFSQPKAWFAARTISPDCNYIPPDYMLC